MHLTLAISSARFGNQHLVPKSLPVLHNRIMLRTDNSNTLMEPSISLQELQKHNKVDDAWIVISGKVLLLKVLLTINLFYCKMLIFAYGRSKQSNCVPVSFSKRQINVLTVPEWGFFVWLAIEAYISAHSMLFFM